VSQPVPLDDGMRYWAFVSYSNLDARWGTWLRRSLESYRVPRQLVGRPTAIGRVPKRIYPVFRDRDELATSADLGALIKAALAQSRSLIVICSPESARSRWVDQEIRDYQALNRGERVVAMIVDGVPHAGGSSECFPKALLEGTEPMAADVRTTADGRRNAFLKVVAGVIGVPFDDLLRRDVRRRRFRQLVAGLVTVVICATALAGGLALRRERAQVREERTRDAARATVLARVSELRARLSRDPRGSLVDTLNVARESERLFESTPNEVRALLVNALHESREIGRFAIIDPAAEGFCLTPFVRVVSSGGRTKVVLGRRFALEEPNAVMYVGAFGLDGKREEEPRPMPPVQRDQIPLASLRHPPLAVQENAHWIPGDDPDLYVAAHGTPSVIFWRATERPGTNQRTAEPVAAGSHGEPVTTLAIREDGSLLATASGGLCEIEGSDSVDNTIRVWSREGEMIAVLRGHATGVSSVAFSDDGRVLVSVDKRYNVRLWDVGDLPGRKYGFRATAAFGGGCHSVATDEHGDVVATGCWGTLKTYEMGSGKETERAEFELSTLEAPFLVRHPAGHGFLVGAHETIELFPWAHQAERRQVLARIAPERTRAAQADAQMSAEEHQQRHPSRLAVSDSGRRIAHVASASIQVIDRAGRVLAKHGPFEKPVSALAFADEETLLVASGGAIRFWSAGSPSVAADGGPTTWLAASERAELLVSFDDAAVSWWHRLERTLSLKARVYLTSRAEAAAVSTRAGLSAVGTSDGDVSLFDLAGNSIMPAFLRHTDYVTALDFSADGATLASTSNDATVRQGVVEPQRLIARLCARLRSHPDAREPGAQSALRHCDKHAKRNAEVLVGTGQE
jgi:WD40 repeat protein